MTEEEWAMAASVAKEYGAIVEWGCGGSSVHFVKEGIVVHSIDTDKAWIEKVTSEIASVTGATFTTSFVDLGPVGEWGYPLKSISGKNYVQALPSDSTLVLIDGRYRVACAIYTRLKAPTAQVLVHDFSREHYRPMLKYFEKVKQVHDLVLLQPRNSISYSEAMDDILLFLDDPR